MRFNSVGVIALLLVSCGNTVSGRSDGTGGQSSADGGSPGGDGDGDGGTGGSGNMGGDGNTGGTASGGSGTGGGPSTWCDDQSRPDGIVEADYQCVDFDEGFPSNWDLDDESEHLLLTQAVAKSAPNALEINAPALNASVNVSTFSWSTVGAQPVIRAVITASINPTALAGPPLPYDTFIEILCLDTGDGRACINYTLGGDVNSESYSGFFLKWTVSSGPPLLAEFPIGNATPNLWSDVSLSLSPGGELIGSVGSESFNAEGEVNIPPTTAITATFGGRSAYGDSGPMRLRMDNVVVTVER
jgi:hypothetical protein